MQVTHVNKTIMTKTISVRNELNHKIRCLYYVTTATNARCSTQST